MSRTLGRKGSASCILSPLQLLLWMLYSSKSPPEEYFATRIATDQQVSRRVYGIHRSDRCIRLALEAASACAFVDVDDVDAALCLHGTNQTVFVGAGHKDSLKRSQPAPSRIVVPNAGQRLAARYLHHLAAIVV